MTIEFTIHGNQDDPEGNPVPYVRSTRGALWRKDGKRYAEWKEYVRAACISELAAEKYQGKCLFIPHFKPLEIKNRGHMEIKVFWKNGAHGDPDNVWKGIADALFVNDRNLDGSFKSQLAEDGKGRVEVEISIDN